MNSTSTSTLITPKAMIDTTVLCGALLTDGVNRQLLKVARLGIYQPVTSNVCLNLYEMHQKDLAVRITKKFLIGRQSILF